MPRPQRSCSAGQEVEGTGHSVHVSIPPVPSSFPCGCSASSRAGFPHKGADAPEAKAGSPSSLAVVRVLFAHLRKPCFGQEPAVASSAPAAGPTPVLPQEAAGGPFSMKLKGLKNLKERFHPPLASRDPSRTLAARAPQQKGARRSQPPEPEEQAGTVMW